MSCQDFFYFKAVTQKCQLDTKYKCVVSCFLNFCPYWLYPAHWFNPGQPEPLLHPTEIIQTGPVPAPLPASLVQYCLQDRHTVQPNNVTQHGGCKMSWRNENFFGLILSVRGFLIFSLISFSGAQLFISHQSSPVHTRMYMRSHSQLRIAFHPLCMMQDSRSTCV